MRNVAQFYLDVIKKSWVLCADLQQSVWEMEPAAEAAGAAWFHGSVSRGEQGTPDRLCSVRRLPPGERPAALYLQIQARAPLTVAPREVPHQPRVLHRAAF